MKTGFRLRLAGCIPALAVWMVLFLPALSVPAGSDPPSEVVLDSIDGEYTPVRFSHEFHVMVAEDCSACHHHGGSGQIDACLKCHGIHKSEFRETLAEQFLPCKKCHGAPDPSNPSLPGLKVAYHNHCFSCHRGSDGLGEGPKGCVSLCHEKKVEK